MPTQRLRQPFYYCAKHSYFERFINIAIIINTFVLCLEYYNQPQLMKDILWQLNNIFTCVFVCESLIKITAFGLRYFRDRWNLFDFFIAYSSLATTLLEILVGFKGVATTTGLRAFRIAKFF